MQGYLKIFVLKELVKEDKTGYELMKSFERFTHKMPSPGTIYPLLNDLLRKRLVTFSAKNNRKIYKISGKGEKILSNLMAERKNALENIISMLGSIYSRKEISRIRLSLNVMSGEKGRFAKDFDVLGEMRASVFDFVMSNEYSEKRDEFREILKNASKKIRSLSYKK